MKCVLFHFLLLLLLLNSSCKSTRPIAEEDEFTVSQTIRLFKSIPKHPKVLSIRQDTFVAPIGGHLQGIQQLDLNHLVVSGSSNSQAYFFIAEMRGLFRLKKRGTIKKMVYINDDFPGMSHNHASGIQLSGNLLAIGTEGGNDAYKSSVVFYDLSNPDEPKPLNSKINRQEDTAGAIGITTIGDSTLLAVGGWDSDRVDFYLSEKSPSRATQLDFKLLKTWHTNSKNTQGWIDANWGTYQSLNFIKDGQYLFLIGFYQNNNREMIADLYQINLDLNNTLVLKKIDTGAFFVEQGASFNNGAGLSTLHLPKRLHFLATERNWNTWIRVNFW